VPDAPFNRGIATYNLVMFAGFLFALTILVSGLTTLGTMSGEGTHCRADEPDGELGSALG